MDKILWLKVIKEELGLLEELAIGMINDKNLTKEEVELAVSRSKIVVREFEMLMNQVSKEDIETIVSTTPVNQEKIRNEPVIDFPIPYILEETETVTTGTATTSPKANQPETNRESFIQSAPAHEIPQYSIEDSFPHSVPTSPIAPLYPRAEKEQVEAVNMEDAKESQSQFKVVPLKSLKEGLSLNDRYLFQRELFNNEKARLDEAVAALDRLTNIREAVEYLKANFKWNKGEASEKFLQLVKRRFS